MTGAAGTGNIAIASEDTLAIELLAQKLLATEQAQYCISISKPERLQPNRYKQSYYKK
jgi:hypothetical protein